MPATAAVMSPPKASTLPKRAGFRNIPTCPRRPSTAEPIGLAAPASACPIFGPTPRIASTAGPRALPAPSLTTPPTPESFSPSEPKAGPMCLSPASRITRPTPAIFSPIAADAFDAASPAPAFNALPRLAACLPIDSTAGSNTLLAPSFTAPPRPENLSTRADGDGKASNAPMISDGSASSMPAPASAANPPVASPRAFAMSSRVSLPSFIASANGRSFPASMSTYLPALSKEGPTCSPTALMMSVSGSLTLSRDATRPFSTAASRLPHAPSNVDADFAACSATSVKPRSMSAWLNSSAVIWPWLIASLKLPVNAELFLRASWILPDAPGIAAAIWFQSCVVSFPAPLICTRASATCLKVSFVPPAIAFTLPAASAILSKFLTPLAASCAVTD